jgi:hypothetical protein
MYQSTSDAKLGVTATPDNGVFALIFIYGFYLNPENVLGNIRDGHTYFYESFDHILIAPPHLIVNKANFGTFTFR